MTRTYKVTVGEIIADVPVGVEDYLAARLGGYALEGFEVRRTPKSTVFTFAASGVVPPSIERVRGEFVAYWATEVTRSGIRVGAKDAR